MNTRKRQMISGPPKGSKSKHVCCMICGTRRDRFDPACDKCYPKEKSKKWGLVAIAAMIKLKQTQ